MPLPVASLGFYDHVLRQDLDGAWWFEALDERALPRLGELLSRLGEAKPRPFELAGLDLAPGALARHTAAVAACVKRIAAGELFQANLTLRLEGRFRGSAADAFLAAAAELEPRHGAFLDLGEGRAVLSFSPELFLRRTGDTVTTSPIKGTAPREAGAEALLGSAKDAAEHVMIVDLSRNDLGRVADYGSVTPGAIRAEPHPGLWHLVHLRTREAVLSLADLEHAAAIVLTSSIRLATPAGLGTAPSEAARSLARSCAKIPQSPGKRARTFADLDSCPLLRVSGGPYARGKWRPRGPPKRREGSRLTKAGPRKVSRPVRREDPARA